jgi:hypothetical protein
MTERQSGPRFLNPKTNDRSKIATSGATRSTQFGDRFEKTELMGLILNTVERRL